MLAPQSNYTEAWSNVLKREEKCYYTQGKIALLKDVKNKRADSVLKQNYSARRGSICVQEKGITLITLIVTIVVLLILAGTSIRIVAGNNRINYKSARSII